MLAAGVRRARRACRVEYTQAEGRAEAGRARGPVCGPRGAFAEPPCEPLLASPSLRAPPSEPPPLRAPSLANPLPLQGTGAAAAPSSAPQPTQPPPCLRHVASTTSPAPPTTPSPKPQPPPNRLTTSHLSWRAGRWPPPTAPPPPPPACAPWPVARPAWRRSPRAAACAADPSAGGGVQFRRVGVGGEGEVWSLG